MTVYRRLRVEISGNFSKSNDSHRYFSNERREDARVDATMALSSDAKGDPFMLQSNYSGRTLGQIRGFLGQEFAEALAQLDPAPDSQGPIKSAYGWHTVKLETVEDSFIPDAIQLRHGSRGRRRRAALVSVGVVGVEGFDGFEKAGYAEEGSGFRWKSRC